MVPPIDLVFLGTGSCYPSPTRGSSSTILRIGGECWMFDCGEGTQIQLQKSIVKPGKITKIFITHLHGDHLFGLPGLMCLIQGTANGQATTSQPLHIYGPVGLGEYVRTCLSLSGTEFIRPYQVHEIDIENVINRSSGVILEKKHTNEMDTEVIKMKNNSFFLFDEGQFKVEAGILEHRLACVGFIMSEKPSIGSLDTTLLKSFGVPPGPLYGKLKSGHSITSSDGTAISPDMVLGPDKPGRKIVIFGDTCDNAQIEHLCYNADVVVHEATHQDELQAKAIECGHSTPSMAADFCKIINAKSLVLFHFSQRYKDDETECRTEEDVCTSYLVSQAQRDNLKVSAARDFLQYKI